MASRLCLHPGSWGIVGGRRVYISHVRDLESVLVRESETGAAQRVKIRDLQPQEPDAERPLVATSADLTAIEDAAWQSARERFALIQPLLDASTSTRAQVHARAASIGRHPATLYRWVPPSRHRGRLASLVPAKRGRRWGQRLLHPDVEAILTTTIDEVYLSAQKRSIPQTYTEVARRCRNAGLRPPHALTVRKRMHALFAQETMRRREGGKAVRETYAPIHGAFPGAAWPLAVVQIDHTPVHHAEVAGVERNVDLRKAGEEAIEEEIGRPLEEPLFPLLAHAIDDVVARTPLLEERSQHLGGILQVRVEHGHEVPARDVEAGPERRLVAVVPGERYHLPAWILLVDAAHDLPAAVLRAVVDEDHLVVDVPSARLGAQPLVEDGKRGRLVVAGNDH